MPLLITRTLKTAAICLLAATQVLANDWQQLIRNAPYSYSQGMTGNFQTLRRWVLFNEGYCEQPERHILFDLRGRFLAWMDNAPDPEQMQSALNSVRESLYEQQRTDRWLPGSEGVPGYPFSFSCDQPHVEIDAAIDRLNEKSVWGTWDGLTAGSQDQPVSLVETAKIVFDHRQSQLENALTELSFNLFLAQMVIESGAVKGATSRDNAIGILQLRQEALMDCAISEAFYRHRMAQVDCAFRLYVLNRRNLEPVFMSRFGHLEAHKRQRLLNLLLVQTYHSGIGNMQRLLGDGEQGNAATYFAEHHQLYSAEDILTGMLFHNIGRTPWGWESLFYLMDIQLVEQRI
ncbi:hypothetical protein [Reinekea marinisedimentorum]|uniref:Transglycosylase-like protein with SLT domain n=1 Tax=Reinekea marinisedimentorum TaxID=230495 RepID=A0A4R3HTJ9_9GAMM|nr:hypothetical protein [Reinekea marinisedimentorum]TCS36382.1 hypothetical protein BCF53_1254 [Reinekea marinisedimentorum]